MKTIKQSVSLKSIRNRVLTLIVLLTHCVYTSSAPVVGHHDITTIPQPTGCYYNNKFYPPGSQIDSGYDPSANWCYGTHCDMDGQIQNWDDFNCVTTPPTTIPPTTVPRGCYYNGRHYPPDSMIEKGYDPSSNWCYSTYCDGYGRILHGDNFNCHTTRVYTTTPAATTTGTPPTTVPDRQPVG